MEGPRPAAIAGAGGRNTLHPLICAAIVAAAAVLAYLNSFQGAFQLDDYKVLLSDPAVRSWGGWWSDLGRGSGPCSSSVMRSTGRRASGSSAFTW